MHKPIKFNKRLRIPNKLKLIKKVMINKIFKNKKYIFIYRMEKMKFE